MRYMIVTFLLLFSLVAFGESRGEAQLEKLSGLGRAARAASASSLADMITGGSSTKAATTPSVTDTSLASTKTTGAAATSTSGYDSQLASINSSYDASLAAVNNGTSVQQTAAVASSGGNQPTLADAAAAQTTTEDPNDPAVYAARRCMALASTSGNTNNATYYANCLCDVIYPGPNKPPQCQSQQQQSIDPSILALVFSGDSGSQGQQQFIAPPPDVFVALPPPPCSGKKCKF